MHGLILLSLNLILNSGYSEHLETISIQSQGNSILNDF